MKRISIRMLLFMTAFLVATGCSQLGPNLVKAGRSEYNIALQKTADEEMLLNVVRLRYGDRLMIMDVGSVSTQFNWTQAMSASALGVQSPGNDEVGLGGGLSYKESPTITYTPRGGGEFVRSVLTPVDIETFMLLANSGWSIERLLRVSVDRMNGIANAPNASGPAPESAPKYEKFSRAAKLLRIIQVRGALEFGYQEQGADQVPVMYIKKEALHWDETRELYSHLGFENGRNVFKLHLGGNSPHQDSFGINIRSLMGMVFQLSLGVDVPEQDKAAGRVTITKDSAENPFDWSLVMGDLFHIHSQQEPPTNAQTVVQYRGSWFYIDDSDMSTKYTIMLLQQLSALLGGKVEKVAPVLTLPIGG